ncbi:MAG TPA: LysM peptidoglycan-binding domain-containing protein [Candidatus Syntrophosphaera thermopropionivorans]|nr:LysM peptidoglycan-binding domain-containing protein [Candidatus Syntrophosphaera thermopropionivorans]
MIFKYYKRLDREEKDKFLDIRPPGKMTLFLLFLLIPFILSAEYITHKVQPKDTLYSLSKKYDVPIEQIQKLNGLKGNIIHEGQVLKIKEQEKTKTPEVPAIIPAKPSLSTIQDKDSPTTPIIQKAELVDKESIVFPEDYYYKVRKGDNLYRIALNNKIKLADLLKWNNFENESHTIKEGDRLFIKDPSLYQKKTTLDAPKIETNIPQDPDSLIIEKIYVVQKKDTLYKIARENGMTVEELKALNNLKSDKLSVGQKIWLVGKPRTLEEEEEEELKLPSSSGSIKSEQINTNCIVPAEGYVSSEFGLRRGRPHKGIDIANKTGTPIYAAMDGVVLFAGRQNGYGNVVIVEHPDFIMTVYAHNEINLVREGDNVVQGQQIATMGATGNATGSHLHFEYRVKGNAINPRKVLPFKK